MICCRINMVVYLITGSYGTHIPLQLSSAKNIGIFYVRNLIYFDYIHNRDIYDITFSK